jgi:hypothetical protein
MVLQCINGVGSNPVEGRTKILDFRAVKFVCSSLDGIWTHTIDTLQHHSLSLTSSALDHIHSICTGCSRGSTNLCIHGNKKKISNHEIWNLKLKWIISILTGHLHNFMHSSIPRQRLFFSVVPITSCYYLQ